MLKTGELLGVDIDAMAHKCANFSEFYAKQLMSGSEDRQSIIDNVNESFTGNEMVYMSVHFLHDKTMEVIQQQMKERFEKARAEAEAKSVSNDTGV